MAKEEESDVFAFDDIEKRDIQWLWWPYIPYGNLTMIFGPGGHGKSYISAALAKAISTGSPLPGQTDWREPQRVLMLSAEDDPHAVIKPRLELLGADQKRIFAPREQFELTTAGVRKLRRIMKDVAATLVTIDPIVSYMGGGLDMNKMNEVRALLKELQTSAMDTGTAMIMFHHSRKDRSNGEDFDKAAGSADFINASRSALYVSKSQGDTGAYILKHVKNNYGPHGFSIGFKFQRKEGDKPFEWLGLFTDGGDPLPNSAGTSPVHAPKSDDASKIIIDTLKDGPKDSQEVVNACLAAGISKKTVYRAAKSLVDKHYSHEGDKLSSTWTLKDNIMALVTPQDDKERHNV